MTPRISVVLVTSGPAERVLATLQALEVASGDADCELVVVDNGSTDETAGILGCLEGDVVVLRHDTAVPYADALAGAVAHARGDLVALLPHAEPDPGWLARLASVLDDSSLDAVQPRLVEPDGRLASAGAVLLDDGTVAHHGAGDPFPDAPPYACPKPLSALGPCAIVRRAALAAPARIAYEPAVTVRLLDPLDAPRAGDADAFAGRSVLVVDLAGDGVEAAGVAVERRAAGDAVAVLATDATGAHLDALVHHGVVVYDGTRRRAPAATDAAAAHRKAFRPRLAGLLARRRFDDVVFAGGTPSDAQQRLAAVMGTRPVPDVHGPCRSRADNGVSVVLVEGGDAAQRRRCLESARRHATVPIEVADDVASARGDWVVLLRGDAVVPRRWLDGLLAGFAAADHVGAVAARHNGTAGVEPRYRTPSELGRFAEDWRRARRGRTSPLTAVGGPCVTVRREALTAAGQWTDLEELGDRLRDAGWDLVAADDVFVHADTRLPDPPAWWPSRGRRPRPGGGAPPLIAACMIVRDEEEGLADALLSMEGLVDEVVLADTGSVDSTAALAERFGCRVIHVPWRDDFSWARNHVLDAAEGVWVFSVDADDRLVCDDPAAVRRLLTGTDIESFAAVNRSSVADRDDTNFAEHLNDRFFLRERFRFVGRIHEQIAHVDGGEFRRAKTTLVEVIHEGYRPTTVAERNKDERNLRLARAFYDEGDAARWWRAYQLGRSVEDAAEREALFREALDLMPPGDDITRADACGGLAQALFDQGRYDDALEAADRALACVATEAKARYLKAACLNRLERHAEARALLVALLDEPDAGDGLMHQTVIRTSLARQELAAAELGLGNRDEARRLLVAVAEDQSGAFQNWAVLLAVLYVDEPDTWLDTVSRLAAPDRPAVIEAAAGLPGDALTTLAERLVDDGLAPATAAYAVLRADPGSAEPWLARLAGERDGVRALVARKLEDDAPAVALRLWEGIDGAEALVGRARCLVAAGDHAAAAAVMDGVDLAALGPADLLFVAMLAATSGDRDAAAALVGVLDGASDRLPAEARADLDRLAALVR